MLFNETGTYTAPVAPFAFIYIEEKIPFPESLSETIKSATVINDVSNNLNKKGQKFLISDTILCQSPTNPAIFSFR